MTNFADWTPEGIIRSWAQAYRDTPGCRFPSDPDAEFFPVDLEAAANKIDNLRRRVRVLEMVILEELEGADCHDELNRMIVENIHERSGDHVESPSQREAK